MHCERCEGLCVVEDVALPMWRCINCGGRHEPGSARSDVRRYQQAMVEILAALNASEMSRATELAETALGVNQRGPHEVYRGSKVLALPRPTPRHFDD